MWSISEGSCLVIQSCPTLCDPMDYSPPGSFLHGILQTRILEWVAISFSRASSRPRGQNPSLTSPALTSAFFTTSTTWEAPQKASQSVHSLSHVWLFVTPWNVARLAPFSMGFSRQEYWGGLLFPSPGDLPNPRIEAVSLMSSSLAGGFFTTSATWEGHCLY